MQRLARGRMYLNLIAKRVILHVGCRTPSNYLQSLRYLEHNMTTAIEAMKDIGRKGTVVMGGLSVNVEVLDFKNSYGQDRWLVTPLSGNGQVWVESVILDPIAPSPND